MEGTLCSAEKSESYLLNKGTWSDLSQAPRATAQLPTPPFPGQRLPSTHIHHPVLLEGFAAVSEG